MALQIQLFALFTYYIIKLYKINLHLTLKR